MRSKQLMVVVVSLLVVILSVSLAYFTTQIIGDGKKVEVSSTNLQIVFTDTDGEIAGADIEPGWSATKTFTVKNDSKSEYKYNIVIKDLVNTFVTNGYLQYKINSTNSGYNMTEFKDVPKSETAKDTILAYSVSIPVGVTQSYTIEFRYANDEDVDQGDDMGKVLKGTLFITEGTEEPKLLSDVIISKSVTNEDGVYNENGYRYEGSDPNNYIQMEKTDGIKETWRIIGIFPDGENGENIIRVRKVGYEKFPYDFGTVNHWPNSSMYISRSKIYSLINYKNTVNYKVYLGTTGSYSTLNASEWYMTERGNTPGATAKDSYDSATSAIVSFGLIYPSDYGYAVLSSDCTRTIKLYNYNGTSACHNNNWLYQGSNQWQWLITPSDGTTQYPDDCHSFFVNSSGEINEIPDDILERPLQGPYSPVMALKSDVVVTGKGTNDNPYVMN